VGAEASQRVLRCALANRFGRFQLIEVLVR